jgi:tetratricopeptide (TPR) repeat protein
MNVQETDQGVGDSGRLEIEMSKQYGWRGMVLLILSLALIGCASTGRAPIEDRDLAAEVREAASGQDSLIDVYPLTDPAAVELMRQARLAEQDDDIAGAAALVKKALEIVPNDPEYWQYQAELELKRGEFILALDHARRSYALGPQVGQLCYRNWLTMTFAWEALYDLDAAEESRQRAEECTMKEQETY